ncbi:MAG: ferritin-like domain-containing protein [Ktedonobacterales bacterium]|nr:ferritin-like domain-containing protein [Ktedonobacterales bacterium]
MTDQSSLSPEDSTPAEPLQESITRRRMGRRSVMVAGAILPMGLLAACGAAATTVGRGTTTSGGRLAALPAVGDNKSAFTEIQSDENAHVQFLLGALKSQARPKPTFKGLEQASIDAFASTSRVLENVGVGAYLMAAPAISNKSYLAAAGSILTIEARHAGFLDVLLGQPIRPTAPSTSRWPRPISSRRPRRLSRV